MYQNFDDEKKEKAPKNPFNRHILKGGQVDPGSKLYQRSVAGREKLDAFLQRLWDQGADEADVFMAGVKALTSRDKGYVGAYLDSNNPGRRYQDNEAKAITDQVMSDLGIGEHPGARLTRPKDSEGKEDRKTSNQIRGTFGPSRPEGEAPRKAMPVGQQRKLGKRSSTGQPVEDSSRPSQEEERQKRQEGRQDYYYTGTNVQRKFMDIMKDGTRKIQERVDSGQITKEQAAIEMSKLKDQALTQAGKEGDEKRRYKGDLTPKEQEQADKKQQRVDEMRQRIAEQKGLRDQEAAAGPETEEAIQVNEGIRKSLIIPSIADIINSNSNFEAGQDLSSYITNVVDKGRGDSEYLSELLDQLSQEISDSYRDKTEVNIDPSSIKSSIVNTILSNEGISEKFGKEIASLKSASLGGEKPSAAPAETAAAPEPAEGAAPETEEAPTTAPEAPKEEEEAPAPAAPEPEAPAAGPSEEEAPKPAQRRRTRAETQEIQKRGSEELAKTQETNRKLEAMTKRMANSPLVKDEEMRDWINNDLERLLKSFTPAEKTEDPWEQDGPEATGIPEPTAQAPASQKALAGQPGPKGLLPPGRTTSRAGKEGPGTKKTTTTPRGGGGRGQKAPEETQKPSRSKGKSPLDQVAKAVLSGIERDKAARESAGQFFNRVRDLIQKQAGKGASKSDVDQAAATAINQQKGRTTRNKARKNTVDSAEYQEFAQSIRSMMR